MYKWCLSLLSHSYSSFEILGCTESEGKGFSNGLWHKESGVAQPLINTQRIYKRIFIKATSEQVFLHILPFS